MEITEEIREVRVPDTREGDSQLSTVSLCSVREACWATFLFS